VAVLGFGLVAVHPLLAGLPALAVAAPAAARRRREDAATVSTAVASLPDAVDLVLVAARAGLPAGPALGAVAGRAPPPWDLAFAAVVRRTARGERLVDAIDQLVVHAGDPARPLRAVLRSTVDDGADLVGALDRFVADARDIRRRRAEETARRVPVRLLLPLVACSLPAFALLSIVPILVGALGALDLS